MKCTAKLLTHFFIQVCTAIAGRNEIITQSLNTEWQEKNISHNQSFSQESFYLERNTFPWMENAENNVPKCDG